MFYIYIYIYIYISFFLLFCWSVEHTELFILFISFHSYILYIHWASKETYYFFRATLTKIQSNKVNHDWAYISYNTPCQAHLKIMFVWIKKEWNKVKSQEVIFQKSQKLLASRTRSSVYGQWPVRRLHNPSLKLNE